MAGSRSEAPRPPTIAQDDDREEALGKGHRKRATRVPEEAEDIGALPPDQVPDPASDQDERGRDERLERNRGLHPARRRVEVANDGRDRDVHHRRVDDEDEHRHRQQDGEPGALPLSGLLTHGTRRLQEGPAGDVSTRLD
jgi:hypothetical protein